MRAFSLILQWVLIPIAPLAISCLSTAKETQPMSQPLSLDFIFNQVLQWRKNQIGRSQESGLNLGFHNIIAGVLCFLAASISSAGGVGGGALFLPILNLVAGLDLKKATTFSAFMVTGGAVSNVLYNLFFKDPKYGGKSLIDYDISLLSEPCMLLGVSIGVICNVIFPEWLITLLFVLLLAFSTFKTCRAGFRCWKNESDEVRRRGFGQLGFKEGRDESINGGEGEISTERPLLEGKTKSGSGFPVKKMLVLLMIWLSFFALHVLRGDVDGTSVINITHCGVGYWLMTLSQIPLAIVFTAYILIDSRNKQHQVLVQQEHEDFREETRTVTLPQYIFPVAALLSGILGGLFGIGGGLIMNPVLLHIGVPPQITAATSSFMVLFSSSMSSVQYLMLGMKSIDQALVLSAICFIASLIGLVIIQRAVRKCGRASLIIFSVSTVMALSTVSMTCFGAIDVWREYTSGQYMGFKLPC